MPRKVELRQFCASRAGDKGNDLNLSLIPYDPSHYEIIREQVTADVVQDYFGSMLTGPVTRYELPNLSALNFVLVGALGGGSTKSLRRDIHGKAMSGPFLDLTVTVPDDFKQPAFPQ